MGHNKLYRNFIILQEDETKTKASKDKSLSGYAKIEAKGDRCKISFYAQNLSKDEKYVMAIICYKKEGKKIVELGSIVISEEGKGEANKEYYVNNIAGLNLSYEMISGAVIIKKKSEGTDFVLYGFINGEEVNEEWKNCKTFKSDEESEYKEEPKLEYKKKKEHKKEESKKEEIKKEECKKEESKKEESKKEESKKEECKKEECKKEECKKEECKKEHKKDKEYEHKEKELECKDNKSSEHPQCEKCKKRDEIDFDEYETRIQNKDIDPYKFNLRGAMGNFFEGMVKDFKEIKDKFKEIKYCKWYEVEVNSIEDMCNTSDYNKYTIAYYPMINYYPYIKRYNNFLLGYKCDKLGELKYIVYGIPGTKDKGNQPYGGKTGFVTWMSEGNTEMGYWLMFYDYKKSIVVIPTK